MISKGEETSRTLLLAYSSPSPGRYFRADIAPLLRLSTLRLALPVLTKLSVCTAPTVGIIGEYLTWKLGQEPSKSPSKEDTRPSITDPPSKLTDGSKSPLESRASIKIEFEASISISSATSRQAPISGANP
ncbi:hypothetical protein AYI68_g4865 [Smittium mucronatum]|uniref:Uncharacterized protein n=1 Tax=Smittium mucronatum TaxID=133383 RepID=A0A1R0GVY3_9FUNG|nr:hypothetical protein AYI68_g4865 [Smittium mucronatum]